MKKKIYTYLALWLLPIAIIAQWSNNPTENTMITDTLGSQVVPIVVTNSTGDSYISWYSEFGDLNFDLYLQKMDKNGFKLWNNDGLKISDHETMTWVTEYDMILDKDENVILVTQDIRTGNSNIFAYKISPSGEFIWGNDGLQLTNTPGFDPAPQVTVTSNNDLIFLWAEEPENTTQVSTVFVSRYSEDGTKLWETNLSDTLDFMLPHMLYTDNDDLIVSWITLDTISDTLAGQTNWMHVFAQKLNANGTLAWENNIQIDSSNLMRYLSLYPASSLESDNNGGAYIMWQSFFTTEHGGSGMPTTYINRIHSDGSIWKPDGYSVSTNSINYHAEAQMEYLEHLDKLMVCWQEYHLNSGTDCWGIYGQLFSSEGDYLWDEAGKEIVPLNCTMDTSYSELHIDESINNDIALFYEKNYWSIIGVDTLEIAHMYALTIDTEGNMIWSPPTIPISLTGSTKYQSALSNLVDNQWVIAWNDNISNPGDNFDFGIYAQNISVNGKLGPLSINEEKNNNIFNINISPNPVSNYFRVEYNLDKTSVIQIDLLSMSGTVIKKYFDNTKSSGIHSEQIDVSDLSSGIYILRVKSKNQSSMKKLIIK